MLKYVKMINRKNSYNFYQNYKPFSFVDILEICKKEKLGNYFIMCGLTHYKNPIINGVQYSEEVKYFASLEDANKNNKYNQKIFNIKEVN